MSMPATVHRWTRADLARLPDDGNRYEVLDGALFVTPLPAPRHQRVALRLALLLEPYCARHALGSLFGPAAVPAGENELQPDVAVIPVTALPGAERWDQLPRPLLVIEVLSESTRIRDLGMKRDAYMRWGIPEYWIVDAEACRVTVVRPGRGDETVTAILRWAPPGGAPTLEIALPDVFG